MIFPKNLEKLFITWASCLTALAHVAFGQAEQPNEKHAFWALSAYYGVHLGAKNFTAKTGGDFSSNFNFGLDLKREFRPNLYLVLSNRIRTDTYYRSGLFFNYSTANLEPISNSIFYQTYLINSHALLVEDVFHFQNFDFFVSAGIGINFMNSYKQGVYKKEELYDGLRYEDYFSKMTFSWNSFWLANAGLGYHVNKKWRLDLHFSFSKDITQNYQLMGISVQKGEDLYVLGVPWPRTYHYWVYPGISYRF